MNEHLIITVWDLFREYIPEKTRELAANQYVDFLLNHEVELEILQSLAGCDPHLDDAIKAVAEDEDEDEEDEEDEDEEY